MLLTTILRSPQNISIESSAFQYLHAVQAICPYIVPSRCVICRDDIEGPMYQAPCEHWFSIDCLEELFRNATVDESLFPAQCCGQPIPLPEARSHLDSALMGLYDKKSIEFSTANRVYCAQSRCSAFVGEATDRVELIRCPECSASTCSYCKAEAHVGTDCSDTDELNKMAERLHIKDGWQRCYSCHHMVELTIGCYHIICSCKAQFCYLCGTKWKDCSCPQFAVPPEID